MSKVRVIVVGLTASALMGATPAMALGSGAPSDECTIANDKGKDVIDICKLEGEEPHVFKGRIAAGAGEVTAWYDFDGTFFPLKQPFKAGDEVEIVCQMERGPYAVKLDLKPLRNKFWWRTLRGDYPVVLLVQPDVTPGEKIKKCEQPEDITDVIDRTHHESVLDEDAGKYQSA